MTNQMLEAYEATFEEHQLGLVDRRARLRTLADHSRRVVANWEQAVTKSARDFLVVLERRSDLVSTHAARISKDMSERGPVTVEVKSRSKDGGGWCDFRLSLRSNAEVEGFRGTTLAFVVSTDDGHNIRAYAVLDHESSGTPRKTYSFPLPSSLIACTSVEVTRNIPFGETEVSLMLSRERLITDPARWQSAAQQLTSAMKEFLQQLARSTT